MCLYVRVCADATIDASSFCINLLNILECTDQLSLISVSASIIFHLQDRSPVQPWIGKKVIWYMTPHKDDINLIYVISRTIDKNWQATKIYEKYRNYSNLNSSTLKSVEVHIQFLHLLCIEELELTWPDFAIFNNLCTEADEETFHQL